VQIKPHKKVNLINRPELTIKDENNECFLVSFKYFDNTQGETFGQWQAEAILADALEKLMYYCKSTLASQRDDTFTIYGNFPPGHLTEFVHPRHVPLDARWARLHITGKQCVIGHVHRNVFYIVFLDKNHRFWKSKKKHT